jgi:hypothetical protein
MTLPTGEPITYEYTMFGGVSWGSSQNQYPSRWLGWKFSSQGEWIYTPIVQAGAGTSNTCLPNYQVGCMETVVAKPDNTTDTINFIVDPYGGSWPQTILNVTTGAKVTNPWDFSNACTLNLCNGKGYQDVRKLSTTTSMPVSGGNLTKQTTYTYDTPQTGNLTAIKEWKYFSHCGRNQRPSQAEYPTVCVSLDRELPRPNINLQQFD